MRRRYKRKYLSGPQELLCAFYHKRNHWPNRGIYPSWIDKNGKLSWWRGSLMGRMPGIRSIRNMLLNNKLMFRK